MGPTNHNANKTMLGATESSDKEVTLHGSDPADFPAGTAVRLASTGLLSKSSGSLIGVSLGESLSDTKKTAVCRTGNRVPLLLTDEGEYASIVKGDLTFTAKAKGLDGNNITVAFLDDEDDVDAYVELSGDTDIIIHGESTTTTASTIKTLLEADEDIMALIGVEVAEGEESTAQTAFSEDNLEGGLDSYPYVVIGEAVQIDTSSGLAVSSGTELGAIYVDSVKTGVYLDGSTAAVGIIDMGGGL